MESDSSWKNLDLSITSPATATTTDTNSNSNSNSRKRPRTTALTLSPSTPSPVSSSSKGKGKGKGKGKEEDSNMLLCGICLCEEEGKTIRGWIDSCNHYFCFVCIMEWSKIESRCPSCKQRFTTIRRLPNHALPQRIINVPLRDQVWHPLGNQRTEQSDPYAEVKCMECQSSSDESLLLLCDLCDSAAHTYCVGLGSTVPEGDWYCHDCTISRNDHTYSQIDNDCCDQDSSNLNMTPAAEASVSISEIVRESYFKEVDRPSRGTSDYPNQSSSSVADKSASARTNVTDSSARTLSRCRNVHSRIRTLRENWDALRSGSLGFSSNIPNSAGIRNKKHNSREVILDESSKLQPLSSESCSQKTTEDNISGDSLKGKSLYDIDRAWKMMDMATSVQGARKRSQNKFDNSDNPFGKQRVLKESSQRMQKEANNHQSGKQRVPKDVLQGVPKEASQRVEKEAVSKSNLFRQKGLGEVVPEKPGHISIEIARQNNQLQKSNEQKPSEGASVMLTQNQVDIRHENAGYMHISTLDFGGRSGNVCSSAVLESLPRASDPSYRRSASGAYSSCKAELPTEESGGDKSFPKMIPRNDDDAKFEIQSLVKLNLKLLSRDKQLGVDGFKEVARLSTHTILAACGLEHKRSSVRPFPNSVCRHNGQSQQLCMSNLMKSSCRKCFYVFVREVVSSIMVQEIAVVRSDC